MATVKHMENVGSCQFGQLETCSLQRVVTAPKVNDLALYPRVVAEGILKRIEQLERKNFPRSEAFDFAPAILGRANTCVLFMTVSGSQEDEIIAYAVTARTSKILLLHKLCVAPRFQAKGLGKTMISCIIRRARQGRCLSIELWVDPNRFVAHRLYQSVGFEEIAEVPDYYSKGRDGVKMTLLV